MKTKWDLKLLYEGNNDPRIEGDLKIMEKVYTDFAKRYVGRKDYLVKEKSLAVALKDFERLNDLALAKPYAYFSYQQDLDSRDTSVEARLNLLSQRYTKSGNLITFFPVALAKIKLSDQKKFLKSKVLAPYHYFLKNIFEESKHVLSEAEEKILNLKSLPASELWVRGNEKMVSKQELRWRGKIVPLSEALGKIHSLPTRERRALHEQVGKRLKSIADFAESELNALVLNKKINDELRGYPEPFSATVLGYQNEPETVENLIATVTKDFPIAHRFYRAKAKMLGLKTLTYADRAAPIGKTKKEIPFSEAVAIIRRSFGKVNPIYASLFDEMLERGQVDVFPRVGKQGGAYCSSQEGLPTFVLLNHLSDFKSVMTLAHEMGHAIHAKFSNQQPPLYRGHSIATAEVASTLFENFAFDEVFQLLSHAEKVVALHDRINDSVQTIFRQVACFNFELDLHQQIRLEGNLSKEKISQLMNQHMSAYLGPLFKLTENDGYFFVQWPHLRNFFYVYSYAFGELVSSALYAEYQKDNSFEQKIRQFLSSGAGASPEDIFAQIGVDVRQSGFFRSGLAKIEQDIAKLEKMI